MGNNRYSKYRNVTVTNSSYFVIEFLVTVSNVETTNGQATKFVENITNFNLSHDVAVNLNQGSRTENVFESKLMVPLYLIIFVLSVMGNSLVLITLIRNKRMRTVTNVYLLNLAISDLLLGVFCMPFTLVGQVLRNFIFGSTMCKLIPYFQAVSVSVAVWTLVAISLERYFAICRPLKSRRWQTQFHAYKMITLVWLASLIWSAPIMVVSTLQAAKKGYKCREVWPGENSEQIYNLFLDVILLLVPMSIISIAYFMIMNKLWKGLRREMKQNYSCQNLSMPKSCSSSLIKDPYRKNNNATSYSEGASDLRQHRLQPSRVAKSASPSPKLVIKKTKNCDNDQTIKTWLFNGLVKIKVEPPSCDENNCTKSNRIVESISTCKQFSTESSLNSDCSLSKPNAEKERLDETTYTFTRQAIRSNFMGRSIEAKKKVIRMLFVVVAEFFICWAPLHILNTWYLFYPKQVYDYVGPTGISLVQLMAYVSSCCNPITYCFMNRRFRQAFLNVFDRRCCAYRSRSQQSSKSKQSKVLIKVNGNNSDLSVNDSTIYVGRGGGAARSEVLVLEAENRV